MNFRTLLLTNIGTTNSVIADTTDRYEPIITVGGVGVVGGDFSHTGFAYVLNKKTELENSVHIELNNTIIEYCFKEQCGRRFTVSMYSTIEQLNKILTSCD